MAALQFVGPSTLVHLLFYLTCTYNISPSTCILLPSLFPLFLVETWEPISLGFHTLTPGMSQRLLVKLLVLFACVFFFDNNVTTTVCLRPGTGLPGQQAGRCLLSVWLEVTVVQLCLDGSAVGILQWLKGLFNVQCASAFLAAVSGLVPSVCKTAAPFLCTSFREHPAAVSVTVATVGWVSKPSALIHCNFYGWLSTH